MFSLNKKNLNNIEIIGIVLICMLLGIYFAKFYQPHKKTVNIYQRALDDYSHENYQNSYYLFAKISSSSDLKPIALYRQALCARELGDKKNELKKYQQLFKYYPTSKLAAESKYLAGQIIVDENPRLAMRYFKSVIKSNLDDDYKLAAKYYIARIQTKNYKYSKNKFKIKPKNVEESFREYLTKYPDGRLAVQVANTWKKFNPNLSSKDNALILKAYFVAGEDEIVQEILPKVNISDSWAIKSEMLAKKSDFANQKKLVYEGVTKYSSIDRADYKHAISKYLSKINAAEKNNEIGKLYTIAKGENKDYILNSQCKILDGVSKYSCYNNLLKYYPNSEYVQDANDKLLTYSIKQQDYASVKRITSDFISKYPESEYISKMKFWLAKAELKSTHSDIAIKYLKDIINNNPDSFYAYRSFWLLNNLRTTTLKVPLNNVLVTFPYKYPHKGSVLYNIIEVKDYDMLSKYSNDLFIKSWAEHEKGNYATSTILAKDGMDKLDEKPGKNDLRWRLVYPQNYYVQVNNNATQNNLNAALIMSIIREESHFDYQTESSVGATGLMQLMPSTANEIAQKNGIDFYSTYLLNPELNIKLGVLYYSKLLKMQNNNDILAVASYNGGAGAINSWKSTCQTNDIDEFIEQIPYDETKNYVIKVLGSYWNYVRIYQDGK